MGAQFQDEGWGTNCGEGKGGNYFYKYRVKLYNIHQTGEYAKGGS